MSLKQVGLLVSGAFLLFTAAAAWTEEADYFTRRTGYQDAAPFLDEKMNHAMVQAAAKTQSCDEVDLHKAIKKVVGSRFYWAKLEGWPDTFPDHYKPAFESSIYSGLFLKQPLLYMGCCAAVVQIGDSLVSGDKLGHFLTAGWEMLYIVRSLTSHPLPDVREKLKKVLDIKESPIASPAILALKQQMTGGRQLTDAQVWAIADQLVVEVGQIHEDGMWGLKSTGVKSYADMAANFGGFRFWSNLIDGDHPYFTCQNGKWAFTRAFRWEDYVSDAWDEALNCDTFLPKIDAVVTPRVAQLAAENNWPSSKCPIEPEKCKPMVSDYGPVASRILHPDCYAAGGGR